MNPGPKKLTRLDWIDAALHAMGQRGINGIAVEPLAKSLGATKGSFYWHFRDREDLITAALERWEQEGTEAVIATLRPVADGRARLRQLLEALFVTHRPTTGAALVTADAKEQAVDRSIALTADASHPAVAAVLTRVTNRRIAYVAEQLASTGIEADEAQHRALLAYTSYLGYATLARSAPDTLPQGQDAQAFVDSMLSVLMQEPA